jgi:hypothetical protein
LGVSRSTSVGLTKTFEEGFFAIHFESSAPTLLLSTRAMPEKHSSLNASGITDWSIAADR